MDVILARMGLDVTFFVRDIWHTCIWH